METIVSFAASAIRGLCALALGCIWSSQLTTLALPAQNAEIFTLTYGSMVRQLIADLEDISAVNKQLDEM